MKRNRWLLTSIAAILVVTAAASAEPICFVQISDLHISDEASTEYLAKAVEWLNNPQTFGKQKPTFVAVTGDLATSGLEAELSLARRELDKLKLPYYVLPGNHDLSDEHKGAFEKVFPGRTQYSLEVSGHRLIFHAGNAEPSVDGTATPIEKWLEAEIAKMPADQPVIMFTHYPYGKGVPYSQPGRKGVFKVLKQRKLLAVLSGHFHGDTTVVEDGVLFKTIPCLTSTRTNHDGTTTKGAAVYTVDGDAVSVKFIPMP